MKYIQNFDTFEPLNEYNSQHKDYVLSNQDKFTISYEVELSARSHFEELYDLMESFENVFKSIINRYSLDVDYDNSLIDTSYYTGVEMKPEEYFNGINEAFKFLEDFYTIYNKQKQFFFSNKTGLHINIGYKNVTNWNILKGYLLLNDEFSYKGFEKRKKSHFAESFKEEFYERAEKELTKKFPDFNSKLFNQNRAEIENILSNVIKNIAMERGDKHIGFNINKLEANNYVEFRYPGGVLGIDDIKNSTINYCNIIQAMADPEYRKQDYMKKLLNLLGTIFVYN